MEFRWINGFYVLGDDQRYLGNVLFCVKSRVANNIAPDVCDRRGKLVSLFTERIH